MRPAEVLKKYWGYDRFRPLQEEIINHVLLGKDTLALLPTGGGKSVCYQVPGLVLEGVCIVVSPLLALMKDQVEALRKKGIKAAMVSSLQTPREIDILLDNVIYGGTKFLYVSPERLSNNLFIERLKKMQVGLVAVDESHCISQWGYDFRPSYLKIADIRPIIPDTPFLAVTATATPQVVNDIALKLQFSKHEVFRQSFARTNLSYRVINTEDKLRRLGEMISSTRGTAIVYMRSRKKVVQIAELLRSRNIPAAAYHAGMSARDREKVQDEWMKDKVRVMVATNAFGMGIDKPDVRHVFHLEVPPDPESYFQEAGRGGRDGQPAGSTILYCETDIEQAFKNVKENYPPAATIKRVYQALGNFLELATGSGEGVTFQFQADQFASTYKLKPQEIHYSFKALEREGLITFTESLFQPSRVKITVNGDTLYRYQVIHKGLDNFIKVLLRSYGGIYEDFVKINEEELARRAGILVMQVVEKLKFLEQSNILTYIPRNDNPAITFLTPRIDAERIRLTEEGFYRFKARDEERLNAMIDYLKEVGCRTNVLLRYFGEEPAGACSICDNCKNLQTGTSLKSTLLAAVGKQGISFRELVLNSGADEKLILQEIRRLIDEGLLCERDGLIVRNG